MQAKRGSIYRDAGLDIENTVNAMKLTDIEKLIQTEGRELLRLLLQAHVDSRGLGDVGASVEGADDILRTHKRIGERQKKKLFLCDIYLPM